MHLQVQLVLPFLRNDPGALAAGREIVGVVSVKVLLVVVLRAVGRRVYQSPTRTKPYNALPPWNGGLLFWSRPDNESRRVKASSLLGGTPGEYFQVLERGQRARFRPVEICSTAAKNDKALTVYV